MKNIVLQAIYWYQKHLSFSISLLRFFGIDTACRFYPTCSQYTYEAVESYGIIRGLFLGFRRMLRCHPWNRGGFDPVPKPNH